MTGRFDRRAIPLLAVAVLAAVGALLQSLDAAAGLDRFAYDSLLRFNRQTQPREVREDPVVVGIDEAFLDAMPEPLSLSHVYLARFLGAMALARPAVVALDLALPEKRFNTVVPAAQPGSDFHRILLAALLASSREFPLVAAKVWDGEHARFRDVQVDYAAALTMQADGHTPLASALFCPDADGRVRHYPGGQCQPGGSSATFSAEVAGAMGRRQAWSGLIDYQAGAPFNYVPMQRVLDLAGRDDTAGLRQLFEGKAVLLGTTLDDTDLLEVPVPLAAWRPDSRRVPGVLAHAQMVRGMLNQGFIQPAPLAATLLLPALFALLWLGAAIVRKFALFALAATALLGLCALLLASGHWLAPGAALATGLAACIARSVLEGWRNFSEKRRLSRTFSGYVSPAVMREIVAGGVGVDLQGRKADICVLFSDIRNFTTLSEHLPAEDVVALLNRYFAKMSDVVHRHEGTVDKFIGDGLMAFFGAPNPLANPQKNALDAAHAMQQELAGLNRELAAEGRAPLAIGIGLHSGVAVVGHIGSAERHAYTAIGDTVNTAARLEGLCKDLGYPVLCSAAVASAIGPCALLAPLGLQPLKGRSPIDVFGWRPAP